MIKIRPPTVEEFAKITQSFGEQFYSHTNYAQAKIPLDTETALKLGARSLEQKLFFIATDDIENIVGGIMALQFPFIFNNNYLAATEVLFFIAPEHRKGGLGIKLLQRLEYQCVVNGVKLLTMVSLSTHEADKVNKLYQHLGYSASEWAYTKALT